MNLKNILENIMKSHITINPSYEAFYKKLLPQKKEDHIDKVYFILAFHVVEHDTEHDSKTIDESIKETIQHVNKIDICKLLRYVFLIKDNINMQNNQNNEEEDDSGSDSSSELTI